MSSHAQTLTSKLNLAADDDLFWMEDLADATVGPRRRPPEDKAVALTPMQARLWFLHQVAGEVGAYNIFSAFEVEGPLDLGRFDVAVQALQKRHEILRTGFFQQPDGQVFQHPVACLSNPFEVVDLRLCPELTRKAQAMALVEEHRAHPFVLGDMPAWSIKALRLGDNTTILTLCIHHILLDAFSIGLLLQDLSRLYAGEVLDPVALHFADLVRWDQESTSLNKVQRSTQRVIQRLDRAERLRLPEDAARASDGKRVGMALPVQLGSELVAAIEHQAALAGATHFIVIGAAYSAALATFSRQRDFILGTSVLSREHAGTERVPGIFVEMLPLRCRPDAGAGFGQWVSAFRDASLDAFDDVHASFQDVVHALGFAGTTSGDPLVSVALSMFAEQGEISELFSGLNFRQVAEQRGARFDMELSIRPSGGDYTGTLVWDSAMLGLATVQAFLSHFEALLRHGLADPDRAMGQLDRSWSPAFPPLCTDTTDTDRLEVRFSAMARQRGNATALICGAQTLSYRQLDEWSTRVAGALIRMGVRPGDLVGLSAKRDMNLMPGLLGILKAGAAYVPLDPAYPAARLTLMAQDAEVKVCVCSDQQTSYPEGAQVCYANAFAQAIEDAPPAELSQQLDASALAYVLFTSGSTGQPKGVCVSHHNVMRLFQATQHWFEFSTQDVWTLFHSYAFDFSVWEMFGALLYGGRLVVVPTEVSRDPASFAELLAIEGVTFLNQTPSAFLQTAAAVLARGSQGPKALRHIVFGGEMLQLATLGPWIQNFGDQNPQLTNMYGITETTVHVTYRPIRREDLNRPSHSPIGLPMPDLGLRLVNDQGIDVPRGAIGEMVVVGAGVSHGYWKREALDRERFSADVWGSRSYRSGDLARVDADGELIYIGRADHQVKVRGFRIELGEIQVALIGQPGVAAAEVQVVKMPDGDQRIVAYITATDEQRRLADLRQHLAWAATFDTTYAPAICDLDDPDFSGWQSSYDGRLIGKADMQHWLQETLERVRALRPRRVLEIGCGTGMLLAGLAPLVEHYCGVDASRVVVDQLARQVSLKAWKHVRLHCLPAHELALAMPDESERYDLVVLNSVVQYFPSAQYLGRVLLQAASRLSPGGAIFVGDLRANATEAVHHLSIALRSTDSPDPMGDALRSAWQKSQSLEAELLVDPGLLTDLLKDRSPRVWPRLKEKDSLTEMSRLRYDCVVFLDQPTGDEARQETVVLTDTHLPTIEVLLRTGPDLAFLLPILGNRRLQQESQAWQALTGDSSTLAPALDPGDLMVLGHRLGRECASMWLPANSAESHQPGAFAFAFGPQGAPAQRAAQALPDLPTGFNDPADKLVAQDFALEVLERLKAVLPSHMRPSVIRLLARFPLTPTGKLDKLALPNPFEETPAPERNDHAMRYEDTMEQQIAEMIAGLLNIALPGRDANFFDIGGHSLLAARVVAMIERRFSAAPSLRAIFQEPTIAAMAKATRAAQDQTTLPDLKPAVRKRDAQWEKQAPASFAQRRFYFMYKLAPLSPAYNICIALRLKGSLDHNALRQAVYVVQVRHEALRTHFMLQGDEILQRIESPDPQWIDYRETSFDGTEHALLHMLRQHAEQPFNLEQGPVLRVKLIQQSGQAHVLALSLHHAHADGASLRVMFDDLRHAYEARLLGRSVARTAAQLQPADIAIWQRTRHTGRWQETQLAFWRHALADVPLPIKWPRAQFVVPSEPGEPSLNLRLDAAAWGSVQTRAQQLRLSPYTLILGAWALALARCTGQCDLVIGSVVSNRDQPELQDVVAALINTVPVRLQLPSEGLAQDWLHELSESILVAHEHGEYPLEDIMEASAVSLGQRRSLFQTLVSWQTFEQSDLTLPGLVIEPLTVQSTHSKSELMLTVFESKADDEGTTLGANLVFDSALLSADLASSLGKAWCKELISLSDPHAGPNWPAPGRGAQTIEAQTHAPAHSGDEPDAPQLQALCALWAQMLKRSVVHPDDDFFEMGGTSLLLLRVASESSRLLGQAVTLALVYEARNCRALLQRQQSQQRSTDNVDPLLVLLGPRSGKPKLFALPDISGQLMQLYPLGARLSDHFEVWGLQIPAQTNAPKNFGELIRPLMRALRSAQDAGPYRFLGYSYGVQLAAQIAARLEAVGEDVDFLLALDAPPMPAGPPVPEAADELWRWRQIAGTISRAFFDHSLELPLPALQALEPQQRAGFVQHALSQLAQGDLPVSSDELQAYWELYGHLGTLSLPSFPTLAAPIFAWVCGEDAAQHHAATQWAAACTVVSLRPAPGTHEALMRSPNVDVLANDVFTALKLQRSEE